MIDFDPNQEILDLDQVLTVTVPFMPIDVEEPTWGLVPFSGKETLCVKCQTTGIKNAQHHDQVATYRPCYRLVQANHPLFIRIRFPEHIDRRCDVCGYEWVEGLAEPKVTGD